MMGSTWQTYNLNINQDARQVQNELQRRWREVAKIPGILRYQLNIRKERVLDGVYGFLLQLNIERGNQRRAPIIIESTTPKFVEDAFNFTKIKPGEKLLELKFEDIVVTVIVNQAPITEFHSLLVPRLNDKLPQIIDAQTIRFAIRLLRIFNSDEFQIGYNSPGAAASVNHLHLHLIHSTRPFFAQRAELEKLRTDIYRVSPKHGAIQAICFLMRRISDDEHEDQIVERIYTLVAYLIEKNIPHNLFFALAKHKGENAMRIMVYPRELPCVVKNTTELNIAFSELSGFIPIADENLYNKMTEQIVLDTIKSVQCNVFEKIQEKIMDRTFYRHAKRTN